jgi:predicted metal-dependent HD superfamily phosphohydrolase
MNLEFDQKFKELCNDSVNSFSFIVQHQITHYILKLKKPYSSICRRYHGIDHILKSLNKVNEITEELVYLNELKYAIFWHDYIMMIYNGQSELLSSIEAVRSIIDLNLNLNTGMVADLILETKYDPNSPYKSIIEYNYMFDIDFSILGSDEKTFDEYDKNIEIEYGKAFDKNARIKFLLTLLNPKRPIFRTELFREKYEQRARNNIRRILNGKYYQIINF